MKFLLVLVCAFGVVLGGGGHGKVDKEMKAVCRFKEGEVKGELVLTQIENQPLAVKGIVNHISNDGEHGFHVHEFGKLDDHCKAAGKHFNPTNKTHGSPTNANRHVGDLGNIKVDHGKATVDITDKVASLFGTQEMSIMNRAIVIHKNPDDFTVEGDGLGNAGERIGCCVITAGSRSIGSTSELMFIGTVIATAVTYFI